LRRSALRGVAVRGDLERLITALFADDTTVYLSEHDSYDDLQAILDRWCVAARARFNVEKTDVLPIGSPAFRKEMVERVSDTALGRSIPASVRVVNEGEMIRSLGAWIGNCKNDDAPWMAMIAKIEKNLEFWVRRKPTMLGRKLIVGMEVGGRSQFLAKAQPMSEKVETRLKTIVARFMANGERVPRIGRETLYQPPTVGGLNLLDVVARNEAIDAVHLKEYLSTGLSRPRWAVVADAIFARSTMAASRNVEDTAKVNAFLQTWKVSTHATAGLGRDLSRIVKVARKYNVTLAPLTVTGAFAEGMPVWYH
ncbi:hypothetical protein K466DRAFT_449709, partial [Polyporus arcularius HHB13444]